MKVLVLGGGGREHALCWALAKSADVDELLCAPGNGGIGQVATCIDIPADNALAVIELCRTRDIGFVVVGPEAPLVGGMVRHTGRSRNSSLRGHRPRRRF